MKAFTASLALVGTVLLINSACYTAPRNSAPMRDDYANAAFHAPAAKRAAREAEIRKLYPTLSEKQIEQKLDTEFPAGIAR